MLTIIRTIKLINLIENHPKLKRLLDLTKTPIQDRNLENQQLTKEEREELYRLIEKGYPELVPIFEALASVQPIAITSG